MLQAKEKGSDMRGINAPPLRTASSARNFSCVILHVGNRPLNTRPLCIFPAATIHSGRIELIYDLSFQPLNLRLASFRITMLLQLHTSVHLKSAQAKQSQANRLVIMLFNKSLDLKWNSEGTKISKHTKKKTNPFASTFRKTTLLQGFVLGLNGQC